MREQYMGKEGRRIKNGDKVDMTFYSYDDCLSSVVGTVSGGYLDIEEGSIPMDIDRIHCTEIRIIDRRKEELQISNLKGLKKTKSWI